MIPIPSGVRVWLATGHTDMRRYAERRIMRSPQWKSERRRGFSVCAARHNITMGACCFSIAMSLSGGLNFPGRNVGAAPAAKASSFSVGSARR